MAAQKSLPVSLLSQNFNMYLHKNREYVINNKRRGLAIKASKASEKKQPDPCDYKICNKKEKKKSLWQRFFAEEPEKPLPPVECCRLRQKPQEDPDLSEFGGQPYRTCGTAYIIQKDVLPTCEHETTKEDEIIKKIEAPLEFKDTINADPLPKFKSPEMRMLEMSDKKIHPLYKRYCMVKKKYIQEQKKKLYKSVCWPIDMHEIPARLNINKSILDKKNMEYMEFKRIEPPRQLLERIVEINRNARPTMEKPKVPVDMKEVEKRQNLQESNDAVFDTLYQGNTKY